MILLMAFFRDFSIFVGGLAFRITKTLWDLAVSNCVEYESPVLLKRFRGRFLSVSSIPIPLMGFSVCRTIFHCPHRVAVAGRGEQNFDSGTYHRWMVGFDEETAGACVKRFGSVF